MKLLDNLWIKSLVDTILYCSPVFTFTILASHYNIEESVIASISLTLALNVILVMLLIYSIRLRKMNKSLRKSKDNFDFVIKLGETKGLLQSGGKGEEHRINAQFFPILETNLQNLNGNIKLAVLNSVKSYCEDLSKEELMVLSSLIVSLIGNPGDLLRETWYASKSPE